MNEREPAAPWRPAVRVIAVMLWGGFISAVLSTLLLVILAPQPDDSGRFAWDTLGLWCLLSWAAALVPLGFGLALASAPRSQR